MIVFLIVLGSIVVFIGTLMLISVGIFAIYREGAVYLAVTIAGIPIPLDALTGKAKPKKTGRKKTAVAKKPKAKRAPIKIPPIPQILPIIFSVLDKLRKSVTVKALEIDYGVGGDPFAAAMTCGMITEFVGILTPLACKAFKIKYSRVVITPNFTSGENTFSGKAAASVHIGSILAIALSALIQFIKIRKENQNGKASSKRPNGGDDAENPRDGRRKYHRGHANSDA